ncbi:hypothetical protein ACP275_02G121200 [Erythranthe tilingii]
MSNSRRFRADGYESEDGNRSHPPICRCGLHTFVQTSWTSLNPGRRFVTCPKRDGNRCKFYEWCDPEICDRRKKIISASFHPNPERDIIVLNETYNFFHTWILLLMCGTAFRSVPGNV